MSSQSVSVISTIVLVIITAYYAIITHRIMKYQRDTTNLDYRPFLKFDDIHLIKLIDEDSKKVKGLKIGIKLTNVGRVMLKYQMNNMTVSIKGIKNDNTVFRNNGGYIYPGQTVDYNYSLINIENEISDVLEGNLEYDLTYYSTENKKYKSYRKYDIFIFHKSNYIEWYSIEEDEKEI